MTIGEYAIVERLAAFLLKHPEMNLHIHYGNTAQLLTLLDKGDINMALVEGNYPKENYEHRKYSTEDYIAVCAVEHKFEQENPKTMKELLQERLLVREAGSSAYEKYSGRIIACKRNEDRRFSALCRSRKYAYYYRILKERLRNFIYV